MRSGCLRLLTALVCLFLGITVSGVTAVVALLNHYAESLPDVSRLRYFEPSETSRIYAADGKLIATLFKENRTFTPFDKISPAFIKAILAVEDSRFYQHRGVDPVGVGRALVSNVLRKDKQGASTITMQLARNVYLSADQTFERKIKEMLLASQIEKKFTKDEILELYLNQIYFGGGAHGVQAAARTYYNKNASDLTTSEAALIAGLPQAPSEFSPLVSEKAALKRQKLVLGRMHDQGFISIKQLRAALLEARTPTFMTKKKPQFQVLELPYFTTWLIKKLADRYDEDLLYRGGLRIQTTVDPKLQLAAEQTVRSMVQTYGPGLHADCAALVCIENKTGYVRAMAGGLGWSKSSQFNRAWQSRRHPGSSFKPIVYAAAVEAGYSPDSIISDSPYTVRVSDTETWSPKNSDGGYMGAISMRTAIINSRNVVAVKLLMMVGIDQVIDLAYRMGITEKLFPNPSLALGAVDLSPMEMATAYTVFPNNGLRTEISGLKAIFDSAGNPVEDNTYPKQEEVLNEITASAMQDMMTSVVERGTGTMAQLPGYKVAGKTGTTDDYRDAWFVGYTPQYTCAVWVGNDNNARMANSFGGNLPARIWQRFMTIAMTGQPSLPFGTLERGRVSLIICRDSKKRATMNCYHTLRETFAPGSVPTGFCPLHSRSGDSVLPPSAARPARAPAPAGDALPPPEQDPLPELPPEPALPDPAPPSSSGEALPAPPSSGEALPAPPSSGEALPPPAPPTASPSEPTTGGGTSNEL